jgi:hypothetical protein
MRCLNELTLKQKIAMLLCFPDVITLYLSTGKPGANKAMEAAQDFSGSIQKCNKLCDCYAQAMGMRSEK